jgi:hypothetical protein
VNRSRGLRVRIARFVDPHQPGWVECHFVDGAGRLWKIIEKVPVVSDDDISESTPLPVPGIVHCVEISRRTDEGGRELVTIDTELPFDIEATDGTHHFEVPAGQIQEVKQFGRVTLAADAITVGDIEHALATSVAADAKFAESLDMLLGRLLAEIPELSSRVTDGVLLEHVETSERRIAAAGIAILIEQTVEPFRIELDFDAARSCVEAGALFYGDRSAAPIGYGSPAHHKLSRNLAGDPKRNFSWKYSWTRTSVGWDRDPDHVG